MRRIRKDALDLEFLPETCKVKFIGPERISYFSTYFDENHEEVHRFDNSSLRYLDVAKLDIPINCLEGLNPESDACVLPMTWSYFMRWIVDNDKLIRGLTPENGSQQQIDFICTNTELKQIMLSLYQESDWNILAHKTTSGIIFYLAYDEETSDNTDSAPQCNPMKKKLSCARFNVIRKITEAVKDRERICNTEMDIFSTISFSVIGQHRILHTGFTEFVMSKDDADKPIDQADFAALKLKPNLFRGRKGDFNIRQYRHLYWWASALVTGVKTFICGDLNKDFTLRKLDVLPASLLEKKSAYERKKCLITLDKILHFIKAEVKEQNRMYKFYLDVKTREVVVTPSEKPIEDYTPPWCKLGDTGVIAFDFGK